MFRLLVAMSFFLSGQAWAVNPTPYPMGKVTLSQWQDFLEKVSAETAFEKNVSSEDKLVAFHDSKTGTQYMFTLEGHPAHPAALVRMMEVKDGEVTIDETGYYAGDDYEFNKLFNFSAKRNRQLADQLNGQRRADERSAAAASGNTSSIGYPTVAKAYETLRARADVEVEVQQGWTIMSDPADNSIWSFTPTDYPAFPAAIKRTILERDGAIYVDMKVLCQAEKAPCDALVEEFKLLNEQMRKHMEASRENVRVGN